MKKTEEELLVILRNYAQDVNELTQDRDDVSVLFAFSDSDNKGAALIGGNGGVIADMLYTLCKNRPQFREMLLDAASAIIAEYSSRINEN